MNNYCMDLNIPIPVLKPEFDINTFPETLATTLDIDQYLNIDLKNLLLELGLETISLDYLYKPAGFVSTVHSDILGGDFTKIIWNYSTGNSTWNWYSTNAEGDIASDQPCIRYSLDDVTLLHSQVVVSPSLVQVGIPHNMTNITDVHRTIGVCFARPLSGSRPTWQESISLFQNYLIN